MGRRHHPFDARRRRSFHGRRYPRLALFEGASWDDAVIQGLAVGPGWLALQFLLLVIGRAFGWFKEDED
jgi:hypothetical protein